MGDDTDAKEKDGDALQYVQYDGSKEETYLPAIRQLISKDLSEPYSIYVYRYFLYQWGDLCYMALDSANELIGVVVCKLEPHRSGPFRGYIAMLAVRESHRGKGIATKLVCMAIDAMAARDADEIVLETEVTNTASLKLYERLGFLRSKRLHRYYLNGNAAFRLILYMKEGTALKRPPGMETAPAGQMMGGPPKMEEYRGFAQDVGVGEQAFVT
ncbi:N-alpha-acetyltransferase 30 [Didymosphaeria variabile]|uniref:N-terminal methionine N(alpha)-acetyltransferase NatC n=1 Tax=Didymosphaeria variabile TaxID=1932322 RepID=A0A9W9C709_9PLEO|nr:N-alpha-acetyltransferase 30 [Didymosphaeria variabile]KAJ4346357.1 N-alpha-acetyltransferase 30 [Didymosphaeria variabile]